MKPPDPIEPAHFRRRHRLRHRKEFQAVYEAKVRKHRGPLTIFALPNGLSEHRLGLSVPRRVGSAPRRNRIKRCLREAFRLLQHTLPHGNSGGYDFIVAVRPHEGLKMDDYRDLVQALADQLHGEWKKRGRREDGPG